tara:strand:- start:3214 stop:3525 length:312 start_codon:yes stop_codon:yes gene_type:complete
MGKRVKSSNKKTISLRQYAGFGGARLSVLTVRNPKTNWMQSDDSMNVVNLSKEEAKKLANDLLAWVDDSIEDDHEWPSLEVQEEVWNREQRIKQRKVRNELWS